MWGRDGRELFYIDGAQRLMAVRVIPGTSFQVDAAAALFPVTDYSLSPFRAQYAVSSDGKGFLMRRRQPGSDFGVVVVFNFLDDLTRRMAAR